MEVHILFGGSDASKDKCFLLLPFLLPKAVLWALHWGWESAEPISAGLAGVTLPEGGGQPRGLGAGGRGAGGWPHTPRIVLGGWKSALLMLDHAANQSDTSDSQRSLSIVGILSYRRTFFLRVSIIWIATVTRRMAHRRHFGVPTNTFSKSSGRREIIVGALPLTQNQISQYVMMLLINKQRVAVESILWGERLGINTPFWSSHSTSIAIACFHCDLG